MVCGLRRESWRLQAADLCCMRTFHGVGRKLPSPALRCRLRRMVYGVRDVCERDWLKAGTFGADKWRIGRRLILAEQHLATTMRDHCLRTARRASVDVSHAHGFH